MADVSQIMKIRATPGSKDVLAWSRGKLGQFSVKSAYNLAFDEAHRGAEVSSRTNPSGGRSCWNYI